MPRKPVPAPTKKPTAKRPAVKKIQVSSRPPAPSMKRRHAFLGTAILVAAVLLAVTIGFSGYNRYSPSSKLFVPVVQQGQGVIYLAPLNVDNLKMGQTFKVAVFENSGSESINAVQGDITYPADKLKANAVYNAESFPQQAATDISNPGLVRFARGTTGHSAPLTGNHRVVTLEFTVIKQDAPYSLRVDENSLLVRSSDNQNILDRSED